MVCLGLVFARYRIRNVAVATRTDATADHHRRTSFRKLLAQLTHQIDGLGVRDRQRGRRIAELVAPVGAGAPCRALQDEASAVGPRNAGIASEIGAQGFGALHVP
jgi:hypothetical protein